LAACNWLLADSEGSELCKSCRLTLTALKLRHDADLQAFAKAEAAKRRLIYQLLDLGLPIVTRSEDPARGLAFELAFRSDAEPILTGHLNGVISVDLSECDNSHRERLRELFGEPYRTLLGHFRHEIAHYYWGRLVARSECLQEFRNIFGDERKDYAAALQQHYAQGPPPDWPEHFVSAYASVHPWEDFAETWAHYFHMVDTLETAGGFGLTLRPKVAKGIELAAKIDFDPHRAELDRIIEAWLPLTFAVNSINRSMGLPDLYPFVLAPPVIVKLAFLHRLIEGRRAPPGRVAGPSTIRAIVASLRRPVGSPESG
jgi:hypothetical protein